MADPLGDVRRTGLSEAARSRASSPEITPGWQVLALAAAVGAVTAAVHWPVLGARALTFDDQAYLSENELVRNPSWASAGRFFGEVLYPSTVGGYYQPLTMVTLMVDCAAGASPTNLWPIHRTNLALHVGSTVLVVLLLHLLTGHAGVSAGVGLLFGVHPLTVEPVAWITERKTLLAAFFSLLALVAYVGYVRGRRWAYAAAIVAFVMALLSKPTSTPLPVVLLLLDFWPLRRLNWKRVLEKVPFLAIAGLSAIITLISQATSAWVEMPGQQNVGRVLLTIGYNVAFYVHGCLWPANLTPFYAAPEPFSVLHPRVAGYLLVTLLLMAAAVVALHWTRAGMVGGLVFLVLLFPTLGSIGFTTLFASDKYVYLPAFGLLLIMAAGANAALQNLRLRPLVVRVALTSGLVVAVVILACATRRQIALWENTERLYTHMVRRAPRSTAVRLDLGVEYARQGRPAEAIEQYEAALAGGGAGVPLAHYNLALTLARLGRKAEAIQHLKTSVEINPRYVHAHLNLAALYMDARQFEDAARHLQIAHDLEPRRFRANDQLGLALAQAGQPAAALPWLEKALQDDPNSAENHANLALVLKKLGQPDRARAAYEQALRLQADRFEIHVNLGDLLFETGQYAPAAESFRQAIRLSPAFAYSYQQLGAALEALGRPEEAAEAYQAGMAAVPEDAELPQRLARLRGPALSPAASLPAAAKDAPWPEPGR